MKNTLSRATWGILFILFGLALAGKALELFDFNIFFDGWWTLFIIVPCAFGLSKNDNRTSSIIGLGIGILLLLSAQGIFEWYMFAKLLIAFTLVVIGISIILKGNEKNNSDYGSYRDHNSSTKNSESQYYDNMNGDSRNNESRNNESRNNESTHGSTNNNDNSSSESANNAGNKQNGNAGYTSNNDRSTNHAGYNHFSGILSGRNVQFVDEVFTGAVISSILGNVQLDLRNAIFNGNAVIETTCILGGVDIFVPSNVKVVINCTPILAGVDNDVISPWNTSGVIHTLFINGTCILGGIEVK